jgi:hypothetical protein
MTNQQFQTLVLKKLKNLKFAQLEIKAELLKINNKTDFIRKNVDFKDSFWGKIGICLLFIVSVFIFYIFIAMCILKAMEILMYKDPDLLKFSGFFVILFIAFTVAIGFYKVKEFKEKMLDLVDYFKLWADFAAVLVPVVVMYKTYYVPELNQASQDNSLLIMLFLNEGLLGIPFVILLIRFIIAFGKLKKEEKERRQSE